ncbi:hypothetical protein D3C81_2028600 [compost metagenome]
MVNQTADDWEIESWCLNSDCGSSQFGQELFDLHETVSAVGQRFTQEGGIYQKFDAAI